MIDLQSYQNKQVTIVDIDNKIWTGYVDNYNPPDDFGNGEEESIEISTKDAGSLIEFLASEIKSIKTC